MRPRFAIPDLSDAEESGVMLLPTGVRVWRGVVDSGRGAPLGVACVDPVPDPERAFVVAMGYGACLDPFELQRFGVLAGVLQARLLVVGTPGYGYAPSALRGGERRALLRADFGPVAARMLTAALEADHTNRRVRPLGVLGYSLGTSVAAAMARVAQEQFADRVQVDSIVLVEPVANRSWSARQLIGAMQAEDKLIDGYLKTNEAVAGAVMPTDRIPDAPAPRQRRLDLLLLSNALRAGRIVADLRVAAAGRDQVKVVVAHGVSSHLSQLDACEQMVRECRAAGIDTQDVAVAGTHGLWQSLPAVNDLAHHLNSALSNT